MVDSAPPIQSANASKWSDNMTDQQAPCTRYGIKAFASAAMARATPEALARLAEYFDVLTTDAALAVVEAEGMEFELDEGGVKRTR
jgi:hypothetical protein